MLAWKKTLLVPVNQGDAKPCVGGVWPLSGFWAEVVQTPFGVRYQSPRSPTATPAVGLMTSTECTRFDTESNAMPGTGTIEVQVAPSSLVMARPQSVPTYHVFVSGMCEMP